MGEAWRRAAHLIGIEAALLVKGDDILQLICLKCAVARHVDLIEDALDLFLDTGRLDCLVVKRVVLQGTDGRAGPNLVPACRKILELPGGNGRCVTCRLVPGFNLLCCLR